MTEISTTKKGSKQADDKNTIRPFPHVNCSGGGVNRIAQAHQRNEVA